MVDGQKDNRIRQETEIYTALNILVGTFALLDGDASDVDIIYFELIWGEREGGGWGGGQKDNRIRQETEICTALIILVGTFALLDEDASDVNIIYFELIEQ